MSRYSEVDAFFLEPYSYKYEKHFPKKSRDILYLKFFCEFSYEITGSINVWLKKKM